MNLLGDELDFGSVSIIYKHKNDPNLVLKSVPSTKEYDILSSLDHPNIITPIAQMDGFLILPRLDPLDIIPSIQQIQQLEDALHYLDQIGLKHGDIHIGNIMMNDDDIILIDFESTKKSDDRSLHISLYNLGLALLYHVLETRYPNLSYSHYDAMVARKNPLELGIVGMYLLNLMDENKV